MLSAEATAATTLPNMVRRTVVLMTTLFGYFKNTFSVIESGALVYFIIGIYSTLTIAETYDRDLGFWKSDVCISLGSKR